MPPRPTAKTGGKHAAVSPLHPDTTLPVLRLTPRAEPAARVPLFYIGDLEFTVPADPGANIALQYLHIAAGQDCACIKPHGRGEMAANDYLLTELLGEDGYQALREFDGLTTADLGQIIAIAVKITLGALEIPKAPASA